MDLCWEWEVNDLELRQYCALARSRCCRKQHDKQSGLLCKRSEKRCRSSIRPLSNSRDLVNHLPLCHSASSNEASAIVPPQDARIRANPWLKIKRHSDEKSSPRPDYITPIHPHIRPG